MKLIILLCAILVFIYLFLQNHSKNKIKIMQQILYKVLRSKSSQRNHFPIYTLGLMLACMRVNATRCESMLLAACVLIVFKLKYCIIS